MNKEDKDGRGGPRVAGPGKKIGRPATGIIRKKHSVRLPVEVKELAQEIAKQRGYPGWGHAVEEGLKMLAKEMGIE